MQKEIFLRIIILKTIKHSHFYKLKNKSNSALKKRRGGGGGDDF